jgi:hypothetical protein
MLRRSEPFKQSIVLLLYIAGILGTADLSRQMQTLTICKVFGIKTLL